MRAGWGAAASALLCSMMAVASASEKPCSGFDALVETTYAFRPSLLEGSARSTKSAQMDAVWQMVQKDPSSLVPCLKTALNRKSADSWFLFDGSQLLVSVDGGSRESKQVLLDAMLKVSLEDVDLRTWVQIAASLGVDDFDTSALGRRWLAYPNAKYYLPEHGAYEVDRGNGTMFIFGALAERYATPALAELCRTSPGETREIATWLLMSQATPEALQALKDMDPSGLSNQVLASRNALLKSPSLLVPRPSPKTTRQQFLVAFKSFVAGDARPFESLVESVPDGERDVVAVCRPEDQELIRKVRRRYIARADQHAIEYYNVFSQILMTMVWRGK